jgi:large subunit ribosomal protein L4
MIKIFNNLKVNARKILFVLPENTENIYLSSRNLQNIKVISVNELNTYDVVNATSLILVDGVQDILQAQYGRN